MLIMFMQGARITPFYHQAATTKFKTRQISCVKKNFEVDDLTIKTNAFGVLLHIQNESSPGKFHSDSTLHTLSVVSVDFLLSNN